MTGGDAKFRDMLSKLSLKFSKRIISYSVLPVAMPPKKRCAEVDLSIYQLDAFVVGETCPRWPMMAPEAVSYTHLRAHET